MTPHPTPKIFRFFCLSILSFALNYSCSKDESIFHESVLNSSTETVEKESTHIVEQDTLSNTEVEVQTEPIEEKTSAKAIETRTTVFPPINDAFLQAEKGYNLNIVRLEENRRVSYLMFDLSQIDSIGGTLNASNLEFTVAKDYGNGTLSVFKGISNDWSEEELSGTSAPKSDSLLGQLTTKYEVGSTLEVALDTALVRPEVITLVMTQKEGDDFAFASKENTTRSGPALVVTYNVPQNAKAIVIEEEKTESGAQTPSTEFGTDTQEQNTTTQEANEDKASEVETSGEGNTQEEETETQQEEIQVDIAEEVTTQVETAEAETSEENPIESEEKIEDNTNNAGSGAPANEEPVAVAEASPSSGTSPLKVTFKGSESKDDKGIKAYIWDFRDGSTSYDADPVHTFEKVGTFEVKLKVRDDEGAENMSTITITVKEEENNGPKAVAKATSVSGEAPLKVQFNGGDSTDDKAVTGYFWDFKDGEKANTAKPSHTFNEPGTYEVELSVSDEKGLTDKTTLTFKVNAPTNKAPVAVAKGTPLSGNAPLTVKFKGSDSTDDKAITGYFWDFKDGASATSTNPSHTFTNSGDYIVTLTVKDAQGLDHSSNVNVTVNSPDPTGEDSGINGNSGVSSIQGAYYVTPSGSASNSGKSESSAWSLEHAFYTARAGDVVYVKAGNYGNKQLLTRNSGTSGSPIKFIGYSSTPGDVSSNQGSTFQYGESVNSSKMPLLSSSNGQGIAVTFHDRYVYLENFQIRGYGKGIETIDIATNAVLKNIIVVDSGSQNSSSAYNGFGITLRGNNSKIENCFVQNAVAQGITLTDSDYSSVRYSSVYSQNSTNPTDYYVLLANGTNNALVERCHVQRAPGLNHNGHGFNIKDNGTYNTFKNCTAVRTSFELTYSGVHNNTIDGGSITGVDNGPGGWAARMAIIGGAHHNTIKNLTIQDTWTAISWSTFNDKRGADASIGNDNSFENVTVKNTDRIIGVGGGTNYNAKARRNKFNNCNFSDFKNVAVSYYGADDIEFSNCSFKNGQKLIKEVDGQYAPYSNFDVSWRNCIWSNVGFTPPF